MLTNFEPGGLRRENQSQPKVESVRLSPLRSGVVRVDTLRGFQLVYTSSPSSYWRA